MTVLRPLVDDEILERFTGQREVRDPAEAKRRLEEAAAALKLARTIARRAFRSAIYCYARVCWARAACLHRRGPEFLLRSGLPRGIAAFIGAAAALLLISPFLIVLRASPITVIAVFGATLAAAGWFLFWSFGDHRKGDGAALVEIARHRYLDACTVRSQAHSALEGSAREYRAAHNLYHGVLEAGKSKLNQLLHANLDLMTGADFESFLAQVFESLGCQVEYNRFPIPDYSVPSDAQMAGLISMLDAALQAGQVAYVHCWGGIGRTGTLVGCYLVQHGLTGEQALARLAELRAGLSSAWRRSPESNEQWQMVLDWNRSR